SLPHTPPLFTDYFANFARLRDFYPQPPRLPELLKHAASFNDYDSQRRGRAGAGLERQKRPWGASPPTLEDNARLRRGAQALVTGQQVALFGGPLYSVYKALSAIRFAKQITQAGQECVPIFWLATEDHDFAEVSRATLLSPSRGLVQLGLESSAG